MVWQQVSELDDLVSQFPGCGGFAGWNDEHKLVSYFTDQSTTIEQELCDKELRTMGDGLARPPVSCLAI